MILPILPALAATCNGLSRVPHCLLRWIFRDRLPVVLFAMAIRVCTVNETSISMSGRRRPHRFQRA